MEWLTKILEYFRPLRSRPSPGRTNRADRTLALYWLLILFTIDTIFALGVAAYTINGNPTVTTIGLLLLLWTVGRTGRILRAIL